MSYSGGDPQTTDGSSTLLAQHCVSGKSLGMVICRMSLEQLVKSNGIAFVSLSLATFVYLVIFGLEPKLTGAQMRQTQVAQNSDN